MCDVHVAIMLSMLRVSLENAPARSSLLYRRHGFHLTRVACRLAHWPHSEGVRVTSGDSVLCCLDANPSLAFFPAILRNSRVYGDNLLVNTKQISPQSLLGSPALTPRHSLTRCCRWAWSISRGHGSSHSEAQCWTAMDGTCVPENPRYFPWHDGSRRLEQVVKYSRGYEHSHSRACLHLALDCNDSPEIDDLFMCVPSYSDVTADGPLRIGTCKEHWSIG